MKVWGHIARMIVGTVALTVLLSVGTFVYLTLEAVAESAYTAEIVVGTVGTVPLIYVLGMYVERKLVFYK
jgi:hypothetical protein